MAKSELAKTIISKIESDWTVFLLGTLAATVHKIFDDHEPRIIGVNVESRPPYLLMRTENGNVKVEIKATLVGETDEQTS